MEWLYLLVAGILEVTWAVFMKMSDGFTRMMPSIITAAGYIASAVFLALALKLVKISAVKETGEFLTGILPLLFVAPAVNLLDCWALLQGNLIPVAIILLVTTVLTFALSGWVTQGIVCRKGGRHD